STICAIGERGNRPASCAPVFWPARSGLACNMQAPPTGMVSGCAHVSLPMPLPIEQYALIGDCHTAALVGSDGSIDWLCFPSFDSAACFAALLGTPKNGRWLIAPEDTSAKVKRRYRGDTLVLETDFETAEGAVTIIDCMPQRDGRADLVRLVRGRS